MNNTDSSISSDCQEGVEQKDYSTEVEEIEDEEQYLSPSGTLKASEGKDIEFPKENTSDFNGHTESQIETERVVRLIEDDTIESIGDNSLPDELHQGMEGKKKEISRANRVGTNVDFESQKVVEGLNIDKKDEKVVGSHKALEEEKKECSRAISINSSVNPEAEEASKRKDIHELNREGKRLQFDLSRFESKDAIESRDADHEDKENIHLAVCLTNNPTSRPGAYAANPEAAAVFDARINKKRRESIEPRNQRQDLEDAIGPSDTYRNPKCLSTNNATPSNGIGVSNLNEDSADSIYKLRRESVPKHVNPRRRYELNMLDARIRASSHVIGENLKANLQKQRSFNAASLQRTLSLSSATPGAISEDGQIRRASMKKQVFSSCMPLSLLEQEVLAKQRAVSLSSTTPGAFSEDGQIRLASMKMHRSSSATSLSQLEQEALAKQRTISLSSTIPGANSEDGKTQRASMKMHRSSSVTSLSQLEQEALATQRTVSLSSTIPGAISEDGQTRRASMKTHRSSSATSLGQLEQGILDKEFTISFASTTPGAFSEDGRTRRASMNMRRYSSSASIGQLEQEVLAKECSISSASTPGAITEDGRGSDITKDVEKTSPTVAPIQENSNPAQEPSAIVSPGVANGPDLYFGTDGPHGNGPLAIAVAVSEDDNGPIPAAVQYKPGAKPPIYQNRRFRFYTFTAAILLVAIGMCITLVVTSNESSNNKNPTTSPTSARENMGIVEQFVHIVGESNLEIGGSPHNQATDWILHEDPLQLPPDAENLSQRYLLALLYFSTTERRPWRKCNAAIGDENSECIFEDLIKIEPEYVYVQKDSFRWLSERHECEWVGVYCDEFNQTRAIDLKGQDILSTFPTELAMMPYIQSLTFSHNDFYGTIPSELASMRHLLNIELHYNFFTGEIPREYYKVYSPQRINFAGNELSGTIPTEVGLLTTVKGFFVQENELTGTLPTEIGNMKFLSKFVVWKYVPDLAFGFSHILVSLFKMVA